MELPGLWQGSSWEAVHSTACISFTAHSAKNQLLPKCRIKNPEFNWTQFITPLSSAQIISSHQPRSREHHQGLTDLRGRAASFSGWVVPTNLAQAELPAAKLYFPFLSWANSCSSLHLYFCINNNKGQNW